MSNDATQRSWADRMRPLMRVTNRSEVMQLRWLGTSGLSLLRRRRILVLETTGRRTGRRRSTPLAYWIEPSGAYCVGGGAGGMARTPDWVANLRAAPAAAVVVRRRKIGVSAEELTGDARDAAMAHATALWPAVERYERRSGRPVPFFRLSPLQG